MNWIVIRMPSAGWTSRLASFLLLTALPLSRGKCVSIDRLVGISSASIYIILACPSFSQRIHFRSLLSGIFCTCPVTYFLGCSLGKAGGKRTDLLEGLTWLFFCESSKFDCFAWFFNPRGNLKNFIFVQNKRSCRLGAAARAKISLGCSVITRAMDHVCKAW